MIITLKLESVFFFNNDEESEEWYRMIEIDSESDLEVLHLAIQDSIDFDNDHMYEFFIADSIRSSKKQRFDDENEGLWNYSVGELFPLPKHKKLFYLFDYGDSWYFRITKPRKNPTQKESGGEYPRVIKQVGKNPEQYPVYDDN